MDKNRYFQIRSGKYIKTKVADIQRLYSKWLWLVMAVYKPLLTVLIILSLPLRHLDRFDVSYPCVGMYRKVPIRTHELVERRMDIAARQAASS